MDTEALNLNDYGKVKDVIGTGSVKICSVWLAQGGTKEITIDLFAPKKKKQLGKMTFIVESIIDSPPTATPTPVTPTPVVAAPVATTSETVPVARPTPTIAAPVIATVQPTPVQQAAVGEIAVLAKPQSSSPAPLAVPEVTAVTPVAQPVANVPSASASVTVKTQVSASGTTNSAPSSADSNAGAANAPIVNKTNIASSVPDIPVVPIGSKAQEVLSTASAPRTEPPVNAKSAPPPLPQELR